MGSLTVWKYGLSSDVKTPQTLQMPIGAEILTVHAQWDISLWARVNPTNAEEKRMFQVVGTGWDCPNGQYIGTIHFQSEGLVFHVFEVTNSA